MTAGRTRCYKFTETANSRVQIIRSSYLARFALIRQKYVNMSQNFVQFSIPAIVGIVVCQEKL